MEHVTRDAMARWHILVPIVGPDSCILERPMKRHLASRLLVPAAVAALAACGSATAPGSAFDPVATQSTTQTIFTPVDSNQAIQSLAVLSNKFTLSGAPVLLDVTGLMGDGRPSAPADLVRRLRNAGIALDATNLTSLFPATVVGKTFVYNPNTALYEASTRTGAPATGVRFILYAVDPILNTVITPLQEIGYLDFDDQTTALHITAVVGGVTYLDYAVSSSINQSASFQLNANGYVTDGSHQVNFTVALSASPSGVTIDYDITAPASGGAIHLQAAGTSSTDLTTTLTITDGTDTTILKITQSGTALDGTITYNGTVVINIAGTTTQPTFTSASGASLTNAQLAALRALGDFIGNVFNGFNALLGPAFFAYHLSGV